MPLDPQAQVMLDALAQLGGLRVCELTPQEARAQMDGWQLPVEPDPSVRVEGSRVPGPAGDIRIYRPDIEGPLPLVVYFHGGGWVIGSIESHHGTCQTLTPRVGAVVVSVDYRLAPEHPYPAPLEDAYTATLWASTHAAELGADASRLAVVGDSAGGNLAAAVALLARDRGRPPIRAQVLVYPVTDRDLDRASMVDNATGYFLERDDMRWFWDHYMGDAEPDGYAAPLRAADLSGLPPAIVVTAEFDPLRDEGEAYARRLEDAGVPTTLWRYDGMFHGFFSMSALLDKGREAVDDVTKALASAL